MSRSTHDLNEQARRAQINTLIRSDYNQFLRDTNSDPDSNSAHVFAQQLRRSGQHWGYSEREIILMLAEELPFGYD